MGPSIYTQEAEDHEASKDFRMGLSMAAYVATTANERKAGQRGQAEMTPEELEAETMKKTEAEPQ